MFFKKNVQDIMIPIENYTVTLSDKSLQEAIIAMRKVYCEVETGRCTEAGHRASLVINEYGHLVGIIDFRTILEALIPNIAEQLTDKLTTHGKASYMERVVKNAEVIVGDIMLDIRGSLNVGDDLLEAIKVMHRKKATVLPVYEGSKLVGVLRDSDLFLAVASVFTE
ncbi:MAG: CBS domain-containing protein [Thermodesulfovibrionia bacterium]|nr:CBS domain-containing protein [Thermodesulfovibrionia bacterium]